MMKFLVVHIFDPPIEFIPVRCFFGLFLSFVKLIIIENTFLSIFYHFFIMSLMTPLKGIIFLRTAALF